MKKLYFFSRYTKMKKSLTTHINNGTSAYVSKVPLSKGYMHVDDRLNISFKPNIAPVVESTSTELVIDKPGVRQSSIAWRTKISAGEYDYHTHADDTGLYVVTKIPSEYANINLYPAAVSSWDDTPSKTIPGGQIYLLMTKYGPDGTLLWTTKIGPVFGGSALNVIINDHIYVAVYAPISTVNFYNTITGDNPWSETIIADIPSTGSTILTKYDLNGTLVWRTKASTNESSLPFNIFVYDSNVYLAITTTTNMQIYNTIAGIATWNNTVLATVTVSTGASILLLKYDQSGTVAWKNQLTTDTLAGIMVMNAVVANGVLYLFALIQRPVNLFSPTTPTGNFVSPIYNISPTVSVASSYALIAYSLAGVLLWRTKITTIYTPNIRIYADENDVYIIGTVQNVNVGVYRSLGNVPWEDTVLSIISVVPAQSDEIAIIKYSSSGELLWRSKIGGTGSEDVNKFTIAVTSDAVYISGNTYKQTGTTFDTYQTIYNDQPWVDIVTSTRNLVADDIYIIKYLSDGQLSWRNTISALNGSYNVLQILVSDYIYIGAWLYNRISDVYAPSANVQNNQIVANIGSTSGGEGIDYIIMKYDLKGNIVWRTSITGNLNDIHSYLSIAVNYGSLYVTGYSDNEAQIYNGSEETTWNDNFAPIPMTNNTFIVKYDTVLRYTLDPPTNNAMIIYNRLPYVLEPTNTIYDKPRLITNTTANLYAVDNKWVIGSVY